ncbi:hypothetical protein TREMEDRAFT_59761 [Tremella mesenterica DSM 1558]|uniref:uncharacterized protein n=1 Tax=Tremella mesenterica (strain ATCC 24925 / CBS 8224 / DSM 1558 / NBRC 9311 / NRRL Y-6157 / RJB 2259-6 / UBC 559-6) TaxID=578456 RepID=UPI0003F49424|nr:uncharacterized protein TREMEDRAFT_59761 [Tremella mesenterica DSM 1558]EIW73587.1 hypothetical protein TREMEDRAFT_59761 [Tremella mesenterica DSM 1558]
MVETVTLGRAKRSTAGNLMRALLDKAHEEDDALLAELDDDEEFTPPQEARDVFLEDFADTDEEIEMDEEETERQLQREERRKAKGKNKAYNPLASNAKPKQIRFSDPDSEDVADTSFPKSSDEMKQGLVLNNGESVIDPSTMAPSTLVLALRKQRREEKRMNRSEARRSTMRASTLRTEKEILQKEQEDQQKVHRKGRKALHEGGEVRGLRPMTQSELITAALEEEERNKEALRDWLKREEEKRELRRVGRKRVRGPRWTWVSRTVGKMVQVVGDGEMRPVHEDTPMEDTQGSMNAGQVIGNTEEKMVRGENEAGPSEIPGENGVRHMLDGGSGEAEMGSRYMRNYIILSQIPGGLPAELKVILGDHVEWDQVKIIPSRNRPINRRLPICPFTGQTAKYKHPSTGIPYANVSAYKEIEALLAHRYIWDTAAGCWMGGEEDVFAEGVEDVEGWKEALHGGWIAGRKLPERTAVGEEVPEERGEVLGEGIHESGQVDNVSKGKKRRASTMETSEVLAGTENASKVTVKRAKSKGKK